MGSALGGGGGVLDAGAEADGLAVDGSKAGLDGAHPLAALQGAGGLGAEAGPLPLEGLPLQVQLQEPTLQRLQRLLSRWKLKKEKERVKL